MRLILTCSLLLCFSQLALANHQKCSKLAKKTYLAQVLPYTEIRSFSPNGELAKDESLLSAWGDVLWVAEQPLLRYKVTGSYHSGWFSEEILVIPATCQVKTILNTYSE
jgi:hypothetical protein